METLVKLSCKDCGRSMSRDESRQVQIKILDTVVDFCNKNDIRYYLSGGTLLGAIRHKGFIPWDDDIDINIPRPDCERLYRLSKGKIGKYILARPDTSCFWMGCGFFRVYDFDTVVEDFLGGATKKYPAYYPIFIDIFPIEGLPEGKLQTNFHYLKIIALRKMQRSAGLEHMMARSFKAHIFHVISRIPAKMIGYKKWSMAIQRVATKYKFDDSKYVGVMTAAVHTTEEKVLKADYIKSVPVEFENKLYNAPGNYDTYLTQLYGDYMKMPPIEKQASHHDFNMYWRKGFEPENKGESK